MEDDFNDFSELSAGDTSIALRRCFAQVAAERDQLRAEVDRLRGVVNDLGEMLGDVRKQRDAAIARAEAAESLVAVLRGALEEVDEVLCVTKAHDIGDAVVKAFSIINTALALTPASAGAKIKAEALDGAWQSIAALETVPAEDLRDRHINEGIRQALDVVFELRQMCDDAAEAEQEDANGRD